MDSGQRLAEGKPPSCGVGMMTAMMVGLLAHLRSHMCLCVRNMYEQSIDLHSHVSVALS